MDLAMNVEKKQQLSNRAMIDNIFKKQRRMTKLHDKDNYLVSNNPIFALEKTNNLKSVTGVEKNQQRKRPKDDAVDLMLACK